MRRHLWAAIVGTLVGCAQPGPSPHEGTAANSTPPAGSTSGAGAPAPVGGPASASGSVGKEAVSAVVERAAGRWVPVPWEDLPNWEGAALHDAWMAWLRSCERPLPAWRGLCPELRQLVMVDDDQRRAWMRSRLQPFRVEGPGGPEAGLMTGYYEPVLDAARQRSAEFSVPLYRPPAQLASRRPWYTRKEIDTLPAAREALRGQEVAWLRDPLDALVLHIQGSGRVRWVDATVGAPRQSRLAFAGSNEQPYRSVGAWLLAQGELRDVSWSGIKDWAARQPQRVPDMLWSNPRYVFFREEALPNADTGPRGAAGVPLTPGRSVAVDPRSIPYGTPVWLASSSPAWSDARLVLAQDTGAAIVGAVRVDYFAGWGEEARMLAERLKQPVRLWVFWPR